MTSSDHSSKSSPIQQSSMSEPIPNHKINHKDDGGCPSPPSYHSHIAPRRELLQDESTHVNGSQSLFERYSEMAKEEGEKRVKDWKEKASDALTFSALFSAVVAALLAISLPELQPDPQDKPTHYLKDIYHLLADPNTTHVHTHRTPDPFSPPKSTVWVNSLWSLSLVMTLSCSLLAILVQQWARRYTKLTLSLSSSSPHQQARTRAFFDKGVEDLHLQLAIDAMPILLHASLVLFLVGLVIFSFGTNLTVFKVVVSWVGLCTVVYARFTLLPIFRLDSPYYTPLSSPLWHLYTGVLSVAFRFLRSLTAFGCCNAETCDRFEVSKDDYQKRFFNSIGRAAEECAQISSPEIDNHILLWALQSSRKDSELEQFFGTVPNFYGSRLVHNPLAASTREKVADALIGLVARTLSSDLLPQSTKQRRITICDKAIAEPSLINRQTLIRVLYYDWSGLLDSVEFGLLLGKASYSDTFAEYYSQCVVSVIIARAPKHDDSWFELATKHLVHVPRSHLEHYPAHDNSMLLANCIFISWRTFEAYDENGWDRDVYSESGSKTLKLVSQFDIQETLPELQHEFCEMWNKLVRIVRSTGKQQSLELSIYILKHIRNLYLGLHQGTHAAPTLFTSYTSDHAHVLLSHRPYPLCTVLDHRSIKGPSPEDGPSAPHGFTPSTLEIQAGVPSHAAP